MKETLEKSIGTRLPVWALILAALSLVVGFYIGTIVGAAKSAAVAENSSVETADGEDHETSAAGSISLSEQAKINIGLTTAVADFRTVEQIVRVPGTVRPHPNRIAFVNTRIEGMIKTLRTDLGDQVVKGQIMAEVQSRRFGNPIPMIQIKAPIAGTVVERHASLGSSVDPSMPLFQIMDLSRVIVEGEVFEDYVPALRLGQRTRVRLNSYPSDIFEGKIIFISSVLDAEKRSARIWIGVDNSQGKLKPEMFSMVAIIVGSNPEAITVPAEAVIEDGPDKFVFVENGDVYQKVDIVTGMSDDVYVEIIDGLYPGDVVVIKGNHQLLAVFMRPQAPGVVDESKPHLH